MSIDFDGSPESADDASAGISGQYFGQRQQRLPFDANDRASQSQLLQSPERRQSASSIRTHDSVFLDARRALLSRVRTQSAVILLAVRIWGNVIVFDGNAVNDAETE